MPKRKRNKCDESEYEYLAKKLRRLERRIKSGRRRLSASSSRSDTRSPCNQLEGDAIAAIDDNSSAPEVGCSYWNDWPEPVELSDAESYPGETAAPLAATAPLPPPACPTPAPVRAPSAPAPADPAPSTGATVPAPAAPVPPPTTAVPDAALQPAAAPAQPPAAVAQPPASVAPSPAGTTPLTGEPSPSTTSTPTTSTLDPDLMAILGEDPTAVKEYGDDIQNDLAIRLKHVATSGLSKEIRKELKEKHLIPGNCKMIKAPILNPEIRASLIESQAKRDKGIENKQTLNACALSSLSRAITILLNSGNKNQELLKLLMDTARVLGDIQHSDSILRRFFILSTVKKDLKDQLEKTKIDDMLFGANLAETLKSAKTINKSGADIRSVAAPRANVQKSTTKAPNKTLNYRAPPASRRPAPAGGARAPRPTPPAPTPKQTTTPQHSYRTSSRQPHPRHRR